MKILFIRGFNTDHSPDIYAPFSTIFDTIEYFNYSHTKNLDNVYQKMCKMIKSKKYDIIMAHSMGGGLMMRYMYDNPEKIAQHKRIILLMPMVYKQTLNTIVNKIPFIDNVSIIKAVLLPAYLLYDGGNLINDNYDFVSLQQPSRMYNKYMLNDKDIVKTINSHENCVLFYATQEAITNIDSKVLDKIKNKEFVTGKHHCFGENCNSVAFFKTLAKYL